MVKLDQTPDYSVYPLMVIQLSCPDAKGPITWQILARKRYPLKMKVALTCRTFQPRLKILAWSFSFCLFILVTHTCTT